MSNNKFKFTKPENWKIIKPEKYKDFSILSTELVPCIYGFAIKRESQGYDVVSMFDYGESSGEFIKELNDELNRLEKDNKAVDSINDYIKENASDYAVTETSSMKPIYHKPVKLYDKNVFVNIMEIKTNVGKSFSLQLFVKLDKNLVCFGTSVPKIDINKPLDSIIEEYEFVKDLVNVLIKSLDIA